MATTSPEKRETLAEIDFEQLTRFHYLFLQPHDGKDLGLTRHQFREAIQKTVGFHMTDDEADDTFAMMDSQSTGKLKWTDYITCIAQHQMEKSYMAKAAIKPLFAASMDFVRSKHRETIVAIRFIPRLELISTTIDYTRGRYIMLARDGTLSFWSINMKPLSYHFVGTSSVKDAHFFIDMVVMYPVNMVAVTSTQRAITMFEFGSKGFVQRYQIAAVADCITCMDYWANLHTRTSNLLLWGDTAGSIHALEINLNRVGGIFGKDENRMIIARVLYSDIIRGKYTMARVWKASNVHYDWVSNVRYLPEYDAFLSSSMCQRTPLVFADWYSKRDHRRYNTVRAVLCFDYSHLINTVVTGELDCCVRVWNFFMKGRPIATLKGHTRPVIKVMLNVATFHVISADKGHAINVYNMLDHTCVQHFSGPSLQGILGRTVITGCLYNQTKNQLVVATSNVAVVTREFSDTDRAEVCSHDAPIVAACYTKVLDQVLSVCRLGYISVWDIHNGRQLLQFRHYSSRNDIEVVPYEPYRRQLEVTAMCLDDTERLAVTGANDGTINLWNFSTGVLLMQYKTPEDVDVTDLCVDKNVIYATGWHRTIYFFDMDFMNNPNAAKIVKNFWRRHKEDIHCLALVNPSFLASGSYDGDVFVVARDTGHGMCRLNACLSRLPINQRGHERKEGGESSMDSLNGQEPMWGESIHLARTSDEADRFSRSRGPDCTRSSEAFDCYLGQVVEREESDLTYRAYENSVDCIVNLNNRDWTDFTTATLITAGAEGWIRAWSIHSKGGLRAQFCATASLGEMVLTMCTDPENNYLITGDTQGYVKVWDLFNWCNSAAIKVKHKEVLAREERLYRCFLFLRYPYLSDKAADGFQSRDSHKRVPPRTTEPNLTHRAPRLLNVFRAHGQTITSIKYVPGHEMILTGSTDCSVRLFLIGGRYVGTCKDVWHNGLINPRQACLWPNPIPLRKLPLDVRRAASARSLTVSNAGRCPRWEDAMRLVRMQLYAERHRKREEARKAAELAAKKKADRAKIKPSQVDLEEEEEQRIKSEEEKEEDSLQAIIKYDWSDPQKSDFLGKYYKPNMHYRPRPYYKQLQQESGQIPAFRLIPLPEICKDLAIPVPRMIIEMEQRKKSMPVDDDDEDGPLTDRKAVARKKSEMFGKKRKGNKTNNSADFSANNTADVTSNSDVSKDTTEDVTESIADLGAPCLDFADHENCRLIARFGEVRKHIHDQFTALGVRGNLGDFSSRSIQSPVEVTSERDAPPSDNYEFNHTLNFQTGVSTMILEKSHQAEEKSESTGSTASTPSITSSTSVPKEKKRRKDAKAVPERTVVLPPISNAPRKTWP